MNDLRTAAQQALEALEWASDLNQVAAEHKPMHTAITALRAALAQQAEPVQELPWLRAIDEAMIIHHVGVADPADDYETAKRKLNNLLCHAQDIGAHFAKQAEPVEPVAYIHRQGNYWDTSERHLTDDEKARGWTEEPLYTAPPQRKPLTEEEISAIDWKAGETLHDFARAVERKVRGEEK
jgi:hypothetical protein